MPSLRIRHLDAALVERLRARARADRMSLTDAAERAIALYCPAPMPASPPALPASVPASVPAPRPPAHRVQLRRYCGPCDLWLSPEHKECPHCGADTDRAALTEKEARR